MLVRRYRTSNLNFCCEQISRRVIEHPTVQIVTRAVVDMATNSHLMSAIATLTRAWLYRG